MLSWGIPVLSRRELRFSINAYKSTIGLCAYALWDKNCRHWQDRTYLQIDKGHQPLSGIGTSDSRKSRHGVPKGTPQVPSRNRIGYAARRVALPPTPFLMSPPQAYIDRILSSNPMKCHW